MSDITGTDTVASMVVWEKGRMKKSDYRKFIIRGEEERGEQGRVEECGNWNPLRLIRQNVEFESMHDAVSRRFRRLQDTKIDLHGLSLIDAVMWQLLTAA